MYYNEEWKNQYITYKGIFTDRSEVSIRWGFKNVEPIETNLDKDCSNFTKKEIENALSFLNFKSVYTVANFLSVLRGYTNWCIMQGLSSDNQNHYDEFTPSELPNYVNAALREATLLTSKEVADVASQFVNPMDKATLIALYEGFEYPDLKGLRARDIKSNKVVCPHTKRELVVSNDLTNAFIEAGDEKNYYDIKTGELSKFKFREQDDTIEKTVKDASAYTTDTAFGKRLYLRITKCLKYSGYDYITTTMITAAGRINFVNERAKVHGMTTREYLHSPKVDEFLKQYNLKFADNFYRANRKWLS